MPLRSSNLDAMETEVKLTKLASCAGCGAKMGAGTLAKMLEGFKTHTDPRLIVGYDKSDDASVYVLDEQTALIQTTDFFPPIVDDPYLYGRIAAVNALSDAHQHTGAADEADRIIQRIRQQGTQGLAEELKKTAGEQTRLGAKEYSAGQSQLSQAMVPYSMAYTDAYTAHLDTLAGGDVGAAAQFQQQAIEQTNADNTTDPNLSGNMQNVNAAMDTLAAAREHTGAGSAARQIMLRFSGRFGGDSAGADGVEPINKLQPALRHSPLAQQAYRDWYAHSIGGRAEMLRAKRIADARAAERQARSANGGDDMSTLVSASNDDASADVAKYAGSVTTSLGGGTAATTQGSGSDTHTNSDGAIPESERLATQLGYSGLANHQLIVPSAQYLIDETVQIGAMAPALSAAADAMGANGALGRQVAASGGEASSLDSRMVIVTNPLR